MTILSENVCVCGYVATQLILSSLLRALFVIILVTLPCVLGLEPKDFWRFCYWWIYFFFLSMALLCISWECHLVHFVRTRIVDLYDQNIQPRFFYWIWRLTVSWCFFASLACCSFFMGMYCVWMVVICSNQFAPVCYCILATWTQVHYLIPWTDLPSVALIIGCLGCRSENI